MAWCKLEDTARHHYKFNRLARELGIRRAEARGLFFGLCAWATVSAPDGDCRGFVSSDIEDAADWEGEPGNFVAAATKVGLLNETKTGYEIHDYFERAESYKKAKSKRKSRQSRVETVSPPSIDRRPERRGEEKRGEDLTLTLASLTSESPPKAAKKPAALRGPVEGLGHEFSGKEFLAEVTHSAQNAWLEVHGAALVTKELGKVKVWLAANPDRKPRTGNGMGQFLSRWLNKAAEDDRRRQPTQRQQSPAAEYYPVPSVAETRRRFEERERQEKWEAEQAQLEASNGTS